MGNKISFKKWVLAHIDNDDAWGDVARDIKADYRLKGIYSYKAIKHHIVSVSGCEKCLDVLDKMYFAYKCLREYIR